MTWRAFIIGLICVVALCLLVPVNDYRIGNTFLTGNHFPVGVFFFLFVLTLGVNGLLKLIRPARMLRQAELMLIWCMMIVAATVPGSGLMRQFPPMLASAPYLAQRPDLTWEDDVLKNAPPGILLSNDPRSPAARKFFEGTPRGEPVRVPWGQWVRPFVTWGTYVGLFYLATIFLCGLLRRQWVDSERLFFATARVPMEFTEGVREGKFLPKVMRSKALCIGAVLTILFGLLRLAPLLTGADAGWRVVIPIQQILEETALDYVLVSDGKIYPLAIGFAFLVPSDVSLSVWFFYAFMCLQIVIAQSIGRPLESGRSGPFLLWQQSGAFLAMAVGMLYMARRYLWGVAKMAFGGRGPDQSEEPIHGGLAFWGLLLSLAGLVAWNLHFGVSLGAALALVALTFSIVLVHMRMVAQGGLFFTQQGWSPTWFLHRISGGRIFGASAAVVASLQGAMFISDSRELLGPHAMNAMRISSLFERRKKLLLPIMLITLVVALVAATYSTMQWVYYDRGVLNVPIGASHLYHQENRFNGISTMISRPRQDARCLWGGLTSGVVGMGILMALRGTFYWWPISPLGFAITVSWCTRELWFSFFLGWLAKALVLKFGGGPVLRGARQLFLGVVLGESLTISVITFLGLLTGLRTGPIFLPY
ncbi:MAG: hypothetical protein GXY85_08685 [Candidatus Brocadiaceae bacterium]|nr:hypothetical protein [Candidatus Brocadiaceae bacterium]